jgi:hypothetical protein
VISLLASSPLLNLFPQQEITDLARHAQVEKFASGETVFT